MIASTESFLVRTARLVTDLHFPILLRYFPYSFHEDVGRVCTTLYIKTVLREHETPGTTLRLCLHQTSRNIEYKTPLVWERLHLCSAESEQAIMFCKAQF